VQKIDYQLFEKTNLMLSFRPIPKEPNNESKQGTIELKENQSGDFVRKLPLLFYPLSIRNK
jgi:hypothetical protein